MKVPFLKPTEDSWKTVQFYKIIKNMCQSQMYLIVLLFVYF